MSAYGDLGRRPEEVETGGILGRWRLDLITVLGNVLAGLTDPVLGDIARDDASNNSHAVTLQAALKRRHLGWVVNVGKVNDGDEVCAVGLDVSNLALDGGEQATPRGHHGRLLALDQAALDVCEPRG